MENVFFEGKVLWSQIDSNMHLRHSAYADFATQARLEILSNLGFDGDLLEKLKIGPVLFREELIYMREIRASDTIKVTCELTHCRRDGSRWSFSQEIYRSDGKKAAQINVQGAWVDTAKRKLASLPPEWADKFLNIPRHKDFIFEEVPEKIIEANNNKSIMTDLEQQLEDAKKRILELNEKPDNQELLELYSLYKQATIGDLNIDKPGMFDFVAAAKYNAWNLKKGMSKEEAQQKYIDYVDSLLKK